ncbi:MAG TPA: NAD-dependent succinate-semialdehyde dehydrogenase [Bacteroidetes bacterium]|nr:NAD-dependent succinate-semialdehyde dehydrogenase [Bacteroidota bacterium]
MTIQSINPATDEVIHTYEEMSPMQVQEIISKTHDSFAAWRKTEFAYRSKLMKNAAEILRDKKDQFAVLMANEMGKPIREGRAEAEKCAWVCDYYAGNAVQFLQDEMVETDAGKSFVTFQPIGVVLAVMPWNFPFWQVFRFAAPALMAGNAGVLKHSSNVFGCALAIEEIFTAAGFPEYLFKSLLISSRQVDAVIENHLVRAVTLTGSTPAGKAVARKAGEMLKKTVLELGGSDPYLILADADLHKTVAACVTGRLINSGQSCIAAKRFIVVKTVREEFEKLYVEIMRSNKMGDPLQEDTGVGPQARKDLRDELHRQVQESIRQGAKCLLGGKIPAGKGAFYPPTILTDVKKGMPAFDEELFGPVAAIIPVEDEPEAIRVANDSIFGLGAAVFTEDVARGERIAKTEIEAGSCFVNAFVKSDPRLPFGGIKESGYGRELSHYGIREFVNIKTIYVN